MAIFFPVCFLSFLLCRKHLGAYVQETETHTAILSPLLRLPWQRLRPFAEIEEVVVTATKRAASTQDIPVAVQALDESTLDDFNINNLRFRFAARHHRGGSGQGKNTIYIRGVASTTPNLTTAGVAGLAPNVALYLDEQPCPSQAETSTCTPPTWRG